MFDVERVLEQAVQPTLDTLLRLEKRLSRSCRSIMAQIRAHLIEPEYSVEKLLKDVGAGLSNWPRSAFKAALDITPWRLIQEGRLEVAAWLLRNTSWRVGDIVVFVGWVDMASFANLFRSWCRMSSTHFRERTTAAEKRAGSIPRHVFSWYFWRRFRRQELSLEEARELLDYFETLYPQPPA
jgi:transcriptional regulator GlxA family with amidase domain